MNDRINIERRSFVTATAALALGAFAALALAPNAAPAADFKGKRIE